MGQQLPDIFFESCASNNTRHGIGYLSASDLPQDQREVLAREDRQE